MDEPASRADTTRTTATTPTTTTDHGHSDVPTSVAASAPTAAGSMLRRSLSSDALLRREPSHLRRGESRTAHHHNTSSSTSTHTHTDTHTHAHTHVGGNGRETVNPLLKRRQGSGGVTSGSGGLTGGMHSRTLLAENSIISGVTGVVRYVVRQCVCAWPASLGVFAVLLRYKRHTSWVPYLSVLCCVLETHTHTHTHVSHTYTHTRKHTHTVAWWTG
jgi:hypothetical protein